MKLPAPRGMIVLEDKNPSRSMATWLSQASDLITSLTASGTTALRPTKFLYIGKTYFDTDLGIPIFFDGTNWVDSAGTTV